MRQTLLLIVLVAFVVPAIALAEGATPGDGSLSVRGGDGIVELRNVRGLAIGLVGQGRVEVESEDCDAVNVWDAEREFTKTRLKPRDLELVTVCVFAGRNVRFRLLTSPLNVRLDGINISLTAVGRGVGFVKGKGGLLDGTYAANGGEYASLPDAGRRFFLLGPQPQPLAAID
jgi:hypothetical protein